jgi:hypothetical protein
MSHSDLGDTIDECKLFQMELHSELNRFLNGNTADRRRILCPLFDSNDPPSSDLRERLGEADQHKRISDSKFAAILAKAHRQFYSDRELNDQDEYISLTDYKVWVENTEEFYGQPLTELREFIRAKAENLVKNVIIQGSLGDHTAINGWSDADTVIILEAGVLTEPDSILQLKRVLTRARYYQYSVDPLQHHGHLVIPEEMLDWYPQNVLPVITFKASGVALFGPDEMTVIPRDAGTEMARKFHTFADGIIRQWENRSIPKHRYGWKSLVSRVLLLPTLYLQAAGEYVYKGESFQIAKDDFDTTWEVIEKASEIRRNWPTPSRPFRGIANRFLYWTLFPGFPLHYQRTRDRHLKPHAINSAEYKRSFLKDAAALAEEMKRLQ